MNKPKFYPLQDSKAPERSWIRYLEAENDDLKKRVSILEQSDKLQIIINWIVAFVLGMFLADYILR